MSHDIYKVSGVIVHDRKLLIVRTKGKDTFYSPGGKPEKGEGPETALLRELEEEVNIRVRRERLEPFGTYTAQAADDDKRTLKMDAYLIHSWRGTIAPSNEIEELAWVNSKTAKDYKIGSIFRTKIIPKLVAHHMID